MKLKILNLKFKNIHKVINNYKIKLNNYKKEKFIFY